MACNQTAVSVLQELCTQRRWNPPSYKLITSEGTPNDPTYEMAVFLHNGVHAKGIGRQKMEAKHDAAQKALIALKYVCRTVNPHKNKGILNAKGELQELCATKHLPQPIYKEIGNQGPDHNKRFTCCVSVSKRQETGVAGTKKMAEHFAAQKMLAFLKNNLGDFLEEIRGHPAEPSMMTDQQLKDFDDEVIEKYTLLKAEGKFLPNVSPGLLFNEYHESYHNQLTGLSAVFKSPRFVNEKDPLVRLKMISSSLRRRITVNFTLGKNKEHVVFMVVDTQPSVVQAGHSVRREHAEQLAALNLIDFLKLMAF